MPLLERALCRSPLYLALARRIVLPWALQGVDLRGYVLEIGSGAGAMAEQLLTTFPEVRLVATDYDAEMVDTAAERLGRFDDRVEVRRADATALEFGDASFDFVCSFAMLHHTVEWERTLGEAVRVLRPGGLVVGYDLVASPPLRLFHHAEDATVRMAGLGELRDAVSALAVDQAVFTPGLGGLVVRFTLRKARAAVG